MSTTKPRTMADLVGDVVEDLGLRAYDDAFWEAKAEQIAAQRAADAEADARKARGRRAGALKAAGFPALAVDRAQAIAEDSATPAMQRAIDFSKHRSVSLDLAGGVGLRSTLVLAGGVGAGKTTAATWLALQARDESPAFVRATELERLTRYGMERKLDELLRASTSVVLDDLGTERISDSGAVEAAVGELVDVCSSNRRPLVITTNLRQRRPDGDQVSPPQFRERYGERVWSRLRETGRWADCGHVDLRRGDR